MKTIGKLVFVAGLLLVGMARADIYYWKGGGAAGEGDWSDPAQWSTLPTVESVVYFAHGMGYVPEGERPSIVNVLGSVYVNRILLQEYNAGWKGEVGSWDTCSVTYRGPGTLYLSEKGQSGSDTGRDMHFENIAVVMTNHLDQAGDPASLILRGHSIWKNSSFRSTASTFYMSTGADVVLDNVTFDFKRLAMANDVRLLFKSGTFDYTTTGSGTYLASPNVLVRDARIRCFDDVTCTAKEFLPATTNGLLFVCGRDGSKNLVLALAKGDHVCLRGTYMATNHVSNCIRSAFTNDCTVYGRGTLDTGFVYVSPGAKVSFDLDTFVLARRFAEDGAAIADTPTELNFRNGTTIGYRAAANDSANYIHEKSYIRANFYGNLTLDAWDRQRDAASTFRMYGSQRRCYNMMERSSVTFRRGQVDACYLRKPVRFARYEVGENASVLEMDSSNSTPTDLRTHDLKIGANATWKAYGNGMVLDANGDVDIDPSATIELPMPTAAATFAPVFLSISGEKPACTFKCTGMQPGYEVRWVGGCAYYFKPGEITTYSQAETYWTGAVSGSWGDPANWGNNVIPRDRTTYFQGVSHTVITNDMEDVLLYRIWVGGGVASVANKSAPFIFRGNPIKVSAVDEGSNSGIRTESTFPFICEAPIVATGAKLGLATMCGGGGNNNLPRGQVVLKGGVTFASGGGCLVPQGFITLGGTSVCGDLKMAESLVTYYNAYRSGNDRDYTRRGELTILKGGSLTVQNQTTVNSATSSLWIAKGGQVKVSGSWNWETAENEHQVNGLLDLDATVGGGATQGYFGTGVLKVKVTDGTDGAKMRLGEGLTLAPTTANWGTMPIDMTSDLTISNATDWTYAVQGGLEVSGPGHKLTVDGAGTTTFATAVSGYDFDICKKGTGTLALDENANGLARGTLDLQAGTIVFKKPQGIGRFAFKSGATIALGSSNGQIAALTVKDDVNLTGLTLKVADDATAELMKEDWTDLLTVPWGFELTGEPTFAGADIKWRPHQNADGSTSLQGKVRKGLVLIVR